MKVAFDIGGVLSKYPQTFVSLARVLHDAGHAVFVITDMPKRDEVLTMLASNGFGFIPEENVYSADYAAYGEYCKAVLLKKLGIDMFFDDFVGYIQWDSSLGPAPIRLLVAPNGFLPYWDENWVCSGGDFGRQVTSLEVLKNG